MRTPSAVQRFVAMVTASWVSAALHAIAVLGVADLLADGPRSAEVLPGLRGRHVLVLSDRAPSSRCRCCSCLEGPHSHRHGTAAVQLRW